MKGLEEYIKKHGRHFTEELAHDVMGRYWTFEDIEASLQKKVYYNVSGCTSGDIVYYANGMGFENKRDLIQWLMVTLLDVGCAEQMFSVFLMVYQDFDFTPYI